MRRSTALCGVLVSLLLTACAADNYDGDSQPEAGITNADDIITEEIAETEPQQETTLETEPEVSNVHVPYEEDEDYDPDAENLFYQGLTTASKDGKMGYIDKTGSWVIEPQFDNAHNFYAGNIAIVRIGEKYGCIDRNGNYLIEPEMDYLSYLCSDEYGIHLYTVDIHSHTKFGVMDRTTGKWLIEPEFEYLGEFEENGLAHIWETDSDGDRKIGLADTSGNIVVSPIFDGIGDLSNGMTWVIMGYRYGYIDETGTVVIEPRFRSAGDFSDDGVAYIRGENGRYGFIDKSGNIIIDTEFDELDFRNGFTENGLALAGIENSEGDMMYGFIDRTGEWVIEPKFAAAESFSKNGLAAAAVRDDSGYFIWGYIDESGSFVIEPAFNIAKSFNDTGLAVISIAEQDSDGKYIYYDGIINSNGDYVAEPKYGYIYYDDITGKLYDEDLILVGDSPFGKYGYIDRNGNEVIEAKYSGLGGFAPNGLASIRNDDDKIGFVNKSGEMVIDFQFDRVDGFYDDGYCVVRVGDKYGIIDSDGNYIAEPVFDSIPGQWMSILE